MRFIARDDRVARRDAAGEGEGLLRRALDRVAGVEEKHGAALGANRLDGRRDAREAFAEVRVGQGVHGVHPSVQIARVEDRHPDVGGRRDTRARSTAARARIRLERTRGSYT